MDASPHHRHQLSLEGVIDFSPKPPLDTNKRARATAKFYSIVGHFEAHANGNTRNTTNPYDRPKLVRLTYEYSLSEASRDIFLQVFFDATALSIDGTDDVDLDNDEEELRSVLFSFADYLFDNFFLPLRASAKQTPQPSPVIHSAVQRAQRGGGAQDYVGTPGRVSELRSLCLIRDRHRCVISRRFDTAEAAARININGNEAKDDDGNLLYENGSRFDRLEVAHILPHALTKREVNSQLHPTKKAALDILNMFDYGAIHLIEGDNIDRPRNALSLTPTLHDHFSKFEIFFEPIPGTEPHTYRINTFLPPILFDPHLPIIRTLYITETRTIDPPSPRLFAIHSAIAHILHLSAAGEYIDKLLDDMDKKAIRVDGSTELGRLVTLKLGGWWDQAAYA